MIHSPQRTQKGIVAAAVVMLLVVPTGVRSMDAPASYDWYSVGASLTFEDDSFAWMSVSSYPDIGASVHVTGRNWQCSLNFLTGDPPVDLRYTGHDRVALSASLAQSDFDYCYGYGGEEPPAIVEFDIVIEAATVVKSHLDSLVVKGDYGNFLPEYMQWQGFDFSATGQFMGKEVVRANYGVMSFSKGIF